MSQPPQRPDVSPFDPSKPHHAQPKLRPTIMGNPVPMQTPQGQQMMIALGDKSQLAEGQLVTSPLVQFMLPHMDGSRTADAIAGAAIDQARAAGAPEEAVQHLNAKNVQALIAQLDAAGMLQGPVFDAKLAKLRADFDASDYLPPGTTAAMADTLVQQELGEGVPDDEKARLGGKKLGEAIDRWMDEVSAKLDDPSFDTLPRLIMAPQLDYWRGMMNFCQVYARLRVVDRPARVVILGSNNFGFGTGVVGCDKGFETPLGRSECDNAFADLVKKHLGDDLGKKLDEHRFDHEREHSIELQMPWIQRVFGVGEEGPKVWAALVHDPTRNNGESYDGAGVGATAFTDALRAAINDADGPTLLIVSANLSHVGASFGDRIKLTDESEQAKAFREKVVSHDRELLDLLCEGKAEEVVASLAWQQNPTRWNSLGQIVVGWRAVDAEEARLLHYMASGDQHGHSAISTAAMAVM